jgi:hypothetical protein
VGITGFLVMILIDGVPPQVHLGASGGQTHPSANRLNNCFTGRSSKEWKLMTPTLPDGRNNFTARSTAGIIRSNSPFTAIRRAWKVLVAG